MLRTTGLDNYLINFRFANKNNTQKYLLESSPKIIGRFYWSGQSDFVSVRCSEEGRGYCSQCTALPPDLGCGWCLSTGICTLRHLCKVKYCWGKELWLGKESAFPLFSWISGFRLVFWNRTYAQVYSVNTRTKVFMNKDRLLHYFQNARHARKKQLPFCLIFNGIKGQNWSITLNQMILVK